MKLYELGTGEPVQVLVKVENASAEYDSTVAFGKEGILLIEPIRYDGKIINFSGDKVHISVIYMEDGIKPLIWEGCRMQTLSLIHISQDNPDETQEENEIEIEEPKNLYALSACLMDADSGRILFGKEEDVRRANASTTKIMTLIVTLERADLNDVVTFSDYAASQPDVQLNGASGEQFLLKDLCFSLMLESHNDSAVAIAEHVAGSCLLYTSRCV